MQRFSFLTHAARFGVGMAESYSPIYSVTRATNSIAINSPFPFQPFIHTQASARHAIWPDGACPQHCGQVAARVMKPHSYVRENTHEAAI